MEVTFEVVVAAAVAVVSSQFPASLPTGGLFGPDLHPWQAFLSGHNECKRQLLEVEE